MRSFLILLFLGNFAFSQNTPEVDSLKTIVKNTENDSVKMMTYNKLRRATYYSDASASKQYTKDYLEHARKLNDSHNIVLAHFFLGNAELIEGNYSKASDNYLVSASYYEIKKDSARLTSVLNSLGAVYEKTENDSLSLHYYLKAKGIADNLKDARRAGISAINIGNIYNRNKKSDKAIIYLEQAVNYLNDNPKYLSFLTLANINLASAYRANNAPKKAIELLTDTLTEIDTINNPYNHASVLQILCNSYLDLEKNKTALDLGLKSYRIFKDNDFKDNQFQMMPELIAVYRKNGNLKKALEIYDSYVIIKDSLFQESNNKQITDAVQKYETEKKDAQLKVLALENNQATQQQKLYLSLAIAGVIIASIIGFFLYKNNKKNKLLAKQKSMLEKTVDEKNILLKETHHRVKNSFQMVSSILFYQSQTAKDKEAKNAIQEAQNRVRSMVLIHQKLYSKEQLVGIDSEEYITDFTEDIIRSHEFNKEKLTYKIDAESHILDIETITPIGLILNELLTNVLKHAFPIVKEESLVEIKFLKQNANLILEVKDNGVGLTAERNENSFGLKLIETLAKKLKGDLLLIHNSPRGTIATLTMQRYIIL